MDPKTKLANLIKIASTRTPVEIGEVKASDENDNEVNENKLWADMAEHGDDDLSDDEQTITIEDMSDMPYEEGDDYLKIYNERVKESVKAVETGYNYDIEVNEEEILKKSVEPLFRSFILALKEKELQNLGSFMQILLPEVINEVPVSKETEYANDYIMKIKKMLEQKEVNDASDVMEIKNMLLADLKVQDTKELLERLQKAFTVDKKTDPLNHLIDYLLHQYRSRRNQAKISYKLEDFAKLSSVFLAVNEKDTTLQILNLDLIIFQFATAFASYIKLLIKHSQLDTDNTYFSRYLTPDIIVNTEKGEIVIEVTVSKNESIIKEKIQKYKDHKHVFLVNLDNYEELLASLSKDSLITIEENEEAKKIFLKCLRIYKEILKNNKSVYVFREEKFAMDGKRLEEFMNLLDKEFFSLDKEIDNFLKIDDSKQWLKKRLINNPTDFENIFNEFYEKMKFYIKMSASNTASASNDEVEKAVAETIVSLSEQPEGHRKIDSFSKPNFYFPTVPFHSLVEMTNEDKEKFDFENRDIQTQYLLKIISNIPAGVENPVINSIRERYKPNILNRIWSARGSERKPFLEVINGEEGYEKAKIAKDLYNINVTISKQDWDKKESMRDFLKDNKLSSFFGKMLKIHHAVRTWVSTFVHVQYRAMLKQEVFQKFNQFNKNIAEEFTEKQEKFFDNTIRKIYLFVTNEREEDEYKKKMGLDQIFELEKLDKEYKEINKKMPTHLHKQFCFYENNNLIFKYPVERKKNWESIDVEVVQTQEDKENFIRDHPNWTIRNRKWVLSKQPNRRDIKTYPVTAEILDFQKQIENVMSQKVETVNTPELAYPFKETIMENINKLQNCHLDEIKKWLEPKEKLYIFKYLRTISDLANQMGHRDMMSDMEDWIQLICASENLGMILFKRNKVSSTDVTMPFMFFGLTDKPSFDLEENKYFIFHKIKPDVYFFYSKPMRFDIGRVYRLKTCYERFLAVMFDYSLNDTEEVFIKKSTLILISLLSLNQDTHLILSLYRNIINNALSDLHQNHKLIKDKGLGINIKRKASALVMYKLLEAAKSYMRQKDMIKAKLTNKHAIAEDGSEISNFSIESVWGFHIKSFRHFLTEMFAISMSDKAMMPNNPGLKIEIDLILKFYRGFLDTLEKKPQFIRGDTSWNELIMIDNPLYFLNKKVHDLGCYLLVEKIKKVFGTRKIGILPLLFNSIHTIASSKSSIPDWRFAITSNYRNTVQFTVLYQRFKYGNKDMLDVMINSLKNSHQIRMHLALKAQEGNKRHFDIVDIETKVWQKIVETLGQILCKPLEGEMISKNNELRAKIIQEKINQAIGLANRLNMTVNMCTGDCTKWAPLSHMWEYIQMFQYLEEVLNKETFKLSLVFIMKWFIQKQVVVPPGVRYSFTELNGNLYPLSIPSVDFVMGQFNFMSSLKHLATQLLLKKFMKKVVENNEWWGITDKIFYFWFDVHSDDFYQINVCADNRTRNIMAVVDKLIKYCFNIKLNEKKTNWSNIQLEMISIFFMYGSPHFPVIKFENACFSNPPAEGWAMDNVGVQTRTNELIRKGVCHVTATFIQRLTAEWLARFYSITSPQKERTHTFFYKGKIIDRRDLPVELFGNSDLIRAVFSGSDNDVYNYGALLNKDKNLAVIYETLKFFSPDGDLLLDEFITMEELDVKMLNGVRTKLHVPDKAKKRVQKMISIIGENELNKFKEKSEQNVLLKYINNPASETIQMVKVYNKFTNINYIKSMQKNIRNFNLYLNLATIASGNSVYFKLKPTRRSIIKLIKFFKEKPPQRFAIYKNKISFNNLLFGRHSNKIIKDLGILMQEDLPKECYIIKTNISLLVEFVLRNAEKKDFLNQPEMLDSVNKYIYRKILNLADQDLAKSEAIEKCIDSKELRILKNLFGYLDIILKPGFRNFRGFNNLIIVESLNFNKSELVYNKVHEAKRFIVLNNAVRNADKFYNDPVNVFIFTKLNYLKERFNLSEENIKDIRTTLKIHRVDKITQDINSLETILPSNWQEWDIDPLLNYLLTITRNSRKTNRYFSMPRPYYMNPTDFFCDDLRNNFSYNKALRIDRGEDVIMYTSKGSAKIYTTGEVTLDYNALIVAYMAKVLYLSTILKINLEYLVNNIKFEGENFLNVIKKVDTKELTTQDRIFYEHMYTLFTNEKINMSHFKQTGMKLNIVETEKLNLSTKKYEGHLLIYGSYEGDKFKMSKIDNKYYILETNSTNNLTLNVINNYFLNYFKRQLSEADIYENINTSNRQKIYYTTNDSKKIYYKRALPGEPYKYLGYIHHVEFKGDDLAQFDNEKLITVNRFDIKRMRITSGGVSYFYNNHEKRLGNIVDLTNLSNDMIMKKFKCLFVENLAKPQYQPDKTTRLNTKLNGQFFSRLIFWSRLSRTEILANNTINWQTICLCKEIIDALGVESYFLKDREPETTDINLTFNLKYDKLLMDVLVFLKKLMFIFKFIIDSKTVSNKRFDKNNSQSTKKFFEKTGFQYICFSEIYTILQSIFKFLLNFHPRKNKITDNFAAADITKFLLVLRSWEKDPEFMNRNIFLRMFYKIKEITSFLSLFYDEEQRNLGISEEDIDIFSYQRQNAYKNF